MLFSDTVTFLTYERYKKKKKKHHEIIVLGNNGFHFSHCSRQNYSSVTRKVESYVSACYAIYLCIVYSATSD